MSDRIRPFDRVRIDSRDLYARVPLNESETLCHVMYARVKESGYPAGDGQPRKSRLGDEWIGFPWLTLILGSGSLEAPIDAATRAASIGNGVRAALGGALDEQVLNEVAQFTVTLANDRLLAGRQTSVGRARLSLDDEVGADRMNLDGAARVSEVAARVTCAAALTTQVFHEMAGSAHQAMSRRSNDVVVLQKAAVSEDVGDDIARAREALDEARTAVEESGASSPRVGEAVLNLLTEILGDLDINGRQRKASAHRIRLLTEVAWYYLVDKSDLYPGWTDLLLRLMLSEGKPRDHQTPRRPRPRYNGLEQLTGVAQEIMDIPTKKSFELNAAGRPVPDQSRQGLYRKAARVLWAQAAAHEQSKQLPPASVFVTTFDLEMEMALMATGEGKSFSIAVPLYVRSYKDAPEAQFCWVMADVASPKVGAGWALENLRRPSAWRVLGVKALPEDLQGRPILVHLCGAPLIDVPELTRELRDDFARHGIGIKGTTSLMPAITVDEYLAMSQSDVELSWLSRDKSDAHAAPGPALPPSLTVSGERGLGVRFWLTLGVPFSDPAVRNRVLAQIGAAQRIMRLSEVSEPTDQAAAALPRSGALPPRPKITAEDAEDPKITAEEAEDPEAGEIADRRPSRADIFGAAVNLYIDDDEVALLHWLGLDVVEDSSHSFETDLEHYIAHVTAVGAAKRPPADAECKLGKRAS